MTQEEVILDLKCRYNSSQDYKEITWFWETCRRINPKVIVEIGVYAGGTLKILSTLITSSDGLVVGIDMDWCIWKKFGWDLNSAECSVRLIDGDSHLKSTRDRLVSELGGKPIDVLFIDGDHTYGGCDLDYKMYSPLVRTGGIIGVHDLNMKQEGGTGDRKCGGWWDDFKGPKRDFFSPLHDNSGYGIGYIIKEDN